MPVGKSAANATEAAAKRGKAPSAGGKKKTPAVPKSIKDLAEADRNALTAIAMDRGIDPNAMFDVEYKLKPELVAAGYPLETIQQLAQADDPHLAFSSFIAEERGPMVEALVANGWDPRVFEQSNLRDLKATFDDYGKPGTQRPSNVRGQTDEPPAVESRLPDEGVARSESPELPEAEKADARNYRASGKIRFSDSTSPYPIISQQEVGVAPDFEAVIQPGQGIREPFSQDYGPGMMPPQSMAEIEAAARGVTPPKERKARPPKVRPLADEVRFRPGEGVAGEEYRPAQAGPSGPIVVGRDFQPGAIIGVADGRPASPSVRPAPPPEVAAEAPAEPGAIRRSIEGSRILGAVRGGADRVSKWNATDAAIIGGTLTGLGYGAYRALQPGDQPAQGQAAPGQPAGQVQPPMLRYEDLMRYEQERKAPPTPPAMPVPGQSTDVIRQMRMRGMS